MIIVVLLLLLLLVAVIHLPLIFLILFFEFLYKNPENLRELLHSHKEYSSSCFACHIESIDDIFKVQGFVLWHQFPCP